MRKETATGLMAVRSSRCTRRPGLCLDRDAESGKPQPRLLFLAVQAGAFNFVAQAGSKLLLSAPQRGQHQSSGRSSKDVPGSMPLPGSPSAGS